MLQVLSKIVFCLVIFTHISGCYHPLFPGEYHTGNEGAVEFAGEKVIIFNQDSASVFKWTDSHTIKDGVYYGNKYGVGNIIKSRNSIKITFIETPVRKSGVNITSIITAEEKAGHELHLKTFEGTPLRFIEVGLYNNKEEWINSLFSDGNGVVQIKDHTNTVSFVKINALLFENLKIYVGGYAPSRFDIVLAEKLNYFKKGETRIYGLGKENSIPILKRKKRPEVILRKKY